MYIQLHDPSDRAAVEAYLSEKGFEFAEGTNSFEIKADIFFEYVNDMWATVSLKKQAWTSKHSAEFWKYVDEHNPQ